MSLTDLFEPSIFVAVRQGPLQVIKFLPQTVDFKPGGFEAGSFGLLLMLQLVYPFNPPVQLGLGEERLGGPVQILRVISLFHPR